MRGIVERHPRERARDRFGERTRGLARVVLRGTQPLRRIECVAHAHEHARAEGALLLEGEAHRQDARRGDASLAQRAQHDARGAGLEWRQRRCVVADALGKECDRAAGRELVEAAREGLVVLRRSRLRLASVKGTAPPVVSERMPGRSHTCSSREGCAPSFSSDREERQSVVMVRGDDQRPPRGSLATLDPTSRKNIHEQTRGAHKLRAAVG